MDHTLLSAALYVFLCLSAVTTIGVAHLSLWEESDQLDSLQAHVTTLQKMDSSSVVQDFPAGAALISGERLTLAGAELQRYITDVTRAMSITVTSSQVELQENASRVTVTLEAQMKQSKLAPFLYRIESSTPFVYVETLALTRTNDVSSQDVASQDKDPMLKMNLTLSASWGDTK